MTWRNSVEQGRQEDSGYDKEIAETSVENQRIFLSENK